MAERPEGRADTQAPARRGGFGVVLWITLVIIAAVGGAAGAWVVAYERGLEAGIAASPPLIAAEEGPAKVAPEDEGGMDVPNQEALVFDAIDEGAEAPAEETLAPPPEEPIEVTPPEPASDSELAAAATPESTAEDVGEGMAEPMEEPGEMAEKPAADQGMEEPEGAMAEEEVLIAPEPEMVDEAMEVAVAPAAEPVDAEPLRIETEDEPEAIVLEAPAAELTPEPEMAEPEMAEPAERAAPPASGPRVQLAAFRSPERAEIGWERILAAHEDLLGGLEHQIVRADLGEEKGIFHRLQAGPMADSTTAKALCEKLKVRDQGCLVVAP